MALRDRGDPEQTKALWKFEAASFTGEHLVGRKPSETAWVKDTQTFLMVETLVYIYGLPPMKKDVKLKLALDHFQLLVKQVKTPNGTDFAPSKLLVPLGSKDTELTGERIWAKAQSVKRDLKGDLYAGIWNKVCPGNKLPSGKSAKEMFGVWWNCHHAVHTKNMTLPQVAAHLNDKTAQVEKPPADWSGPTLAHVFEKFGLPARHHPDQAFWTCDEQAIFDASDGVHELSAVDAKFASRATSRAQKLEQNCFVSLDRATKVSESKTEDTRARAEATYAESQLHSARIAGWREQIAALQEARRAAMEDAALAADLDDPDFDPRALKVQALKLGAQLRFLSANPPAPTAPSSSSTAPSFTSPSWSPRSSTSTSTHTTARTHMTPRTSRSPRRPLPPGTPDEHESDVEWSQDGQNDAREDTPPASPAAAPTDEHTRERDTARRLWEMSNSPPPGSPQTAELPTHADSFFAVSPTRASTPPPPQPAAVRRSPRHTPAKYALFAHTATEHPIAHWSVWRPTLGIQALLVLHQHVYFHQHQGWGCRDTWNVVAPMWGTPLSWAFADHSAMPWGEIFVGRSASARPWGLHDTFTVLVDSDCRVTWLPRRGGSGWGSGFR